jgi:hypothetical protein
MQQSELQLELNKFRDYVISQAKANLTRGGKNISKGLYNSIKGNVKASPNSFQMTFSMDEYGIYQDKGVKGANPSLVKNGEQKAPNSPYKFQSKKPPMKPLMEWAKRKNIRFRNEDGTYRKGGYMTIGFWLQKRIFAQGIRPSLFFTTPFEKAYKNLPDELLEAYGLEVQRLFNNSIKLTNIK